MADCWHLHLDCYLGGLMSATRVLAILRNKHVTKSNNSVLATIASFADESTGKDCYPSHETIQEVSGLSVRQVFNSIKWAIDNGFPIKVIKQGMSGEEGYVRKNHYEFGSASEIEHWTSTERVQPVPTPSISEVSVGNHCSERRQPLHRTPATIADNHTKIIPRSNHIREQPNDDSTEVVEGSQKMFDQRDEFYRSQCKQVIDEC